MCVCVCVCVCACVHACMRACVRVIVYHSFVELTSMHCLLYFDCAVEGCPRSTREKNGALITVSSGRAYGNYLYCYIIYLFILQSLAE